MRCAAAPNKGIGLLFCRSCDRARQVSAPKDILDVTVTHPPRISQQRTAFQGTETKGDRGDAGFEVAFVPA